MIRVLHCPNIVGGNPQGLARAEREVGLDSWSVSFTQSPFGYNTDEIVWGNGSNPLTFEARRWRLLWRTLRDFDIVHFNAGQTIMPKWVPAIGNTEFKRLPRAWRMLLPAYQLYARLFELRDLPLLKAMGKGVVVTFQGSDARQGDVCRAQFKISPAVEAEASHFSPALDRRKRQRIRRFARYADRIYALNPDLLHVLPPQAEFLPYSHIDLRTWVPPQRVRPAGETPIVVHAPSHRAVKGTQHVLDAVAQLEREGVRVELTLVEGMPLDEARQIYERADLVVDQLLCGWYGGLAVEAMALGKPVVCYIREEDLKFVPDGMRQELPIIAATPETICSVLREWLTTRRSELAEVGSRGRAYVEKWHDPLQIAERLKADYEAILADRRTHTWRKDTEKGRTV
jgi:glycosyltransferase involved in cell wall biosynthesis